MTTTGTRAFFLGVCLMGWVAMAMSCDTRDCPKLPCNEPVKLRGQCCPYCPCEYDGYYYDVGDIVFTDDQCVTCECSKYGIDCMPFPCPPADCPNPVLEDGECCPECGCMVEGILYDLGYQVHTRNPCDDCRCEINGEVVCEKKICPAITCSNPIRINGECCKECGCKGKKGVIHNFGPIDPEDECRPCVCNEDGTISCAEPACAAVTCPKKNQYIPDGECCPKCRCLAEGEEFYEGDTMLSKDVCDVQCMCGSDGTKVCATMDCPEITCENPIYIRGQCCPVCGCKAKDGAILPFGPVPTDDKCRPCTCNPDGMVTCEEPVCPEVACDGKQKYIPVGECCPKCRCNFKSKWYNTGDDMPINVKDPCVEKCHCGEDGNEVCDNMVCPMMHCENPVTLPGECCPQCGCINNKQLIPYGPIRDDPCQECECASTGNITCGRKQTCPKVKCVSGLYKPEPDEPKQCCQKCRCKFGGEIYKPGETFEGPKCQQCECRAFTGRVSCEKYNCSHVQLECPNPAYKKGDCCPSCPNGPACSYQGKIIEYGQYKILKKLVCTCLGDPWFPNAFCAPSTVAKKVSKAYDGVWNPYGYPGMKIKQAKNTKGKNKKQ